MVAAIHVDSFFVALLVMAIAGLSNWLQQRAQSREQPKPKGPVPPIRLSQPRPLRPLRPSGGPIPPAETTLERELRRLLGGEEPVSPPPVVLAQRPTAPVPRSSELPRVGSVTPLPPLVGTVAPSPTAAAALSPSDLARPHPQQIQEVVAERMRQVDQQTRQHTRAVVVRSGSYPSPSFVVSRLKGNRQALRQAFVASLVFGPPKGLEELPGA